MAANDEGEVEEPVVEIQDSVQSSTWNVNQTRMHISFFKDNPVLWDKRLKDHGKQN